MIGKLKGKIDSLFNDYVIVDVAGVGYLVYCPVNNLQSFVPGKLCELYIETHVREDHINLYGFLNLEEKVCFSTLQSVSGIGPRMALNILSNLSVKEIELAVGSKNKEIFRKISGVGLKLAERILIELQGKVSKINFDSSDPLNNKIAEKNNIAQDGISALVNLGINKNQAQNIVSGILGQNPDITVDELIRQSLKRRN